MLEVYVLLLRVCVVCVQWVFRLCVCCVYVVLVMLTNGGVIDCVCAV